MNYDTILSAHRRYELKRQEDQSDSYGSKPAIINRGVP